MSQEPGSKWVVAASIAAVFGCITGVTSLVWQAVDKSSQFAESLDIQFKQFVYRDFEVPGGAILHGVEITNLGYRDAYLETILLMSDTDTFRLSVLSKNTLGQSGAVLRSAESRSVEFQQMPQHVAEELILNGCWIGARVETSRGGVFISRGGSEFLDNAKKEVLLRQMLAERMQAGTKEHSSGRVSVTVADIRALDERWKELTASKDPRAVCHKRSRSVHDVAAQGHEVGVE